MKYKLCSVHGKSFEGDKLKGRTNPIPCRDEIIPDPDSIPLSVLHHHPLGRRHEINFAAYDPPEPMPSPTEGAHPGFVLCLVLHLRFLPGYRLGVYYGYIYNGESFAGHMCRFAFNQGKTEGAFIATGGYYLYTEYEEYNITGSWNTPLEDGRIPFEFKIDFAQEWNNMELKGVFDLEENSLRGVVVYSNFYKTGEFVFKRDPDLVRSYPAPSVINARKRWQFALTSVLVRIRRQAWSSKQIFQRLRDGRRFMELGLKEKCGKSMSDDELAEYNALVSTLYEADVQFYGSLINIDASKRTIFS